MNTTLLTSDLWTVKAQAEQQVVSLIRSSHRVSGAQEVTQSFNEIREALAERDVDGWGLLIDMRQAIPSQDPEIEDAFRRNRKVLKRRFSRLAILLRSATGVLQVQRMLKKAPDDTIRVYNAPEAAARWAAQGVE